MFSEYILRIIWFIQRAISWKFKIKIKFKNSISIREENIPDIKIYEITKQSWPLQHYKQHLMMNRRIIGIWNAMLYPKTGVIRLNNKIITESSVWDSASTSRFNPRPLSGPFLNGIYQVLPDNGFYHFLIEDLPRFLETNSLKLNQKTLIASKNSYIIEMLNLLEIKNYILCSYPVVCEQLLLSEKIKGGIFNSIDRLNLRFLLSKRLKKNESEKIFVARQNIVKGRESRGLEFTDEIWELLSKFDFKRVYLEEISLDEQMAIFSSSEIIVGFHGAGLANIIWSKPSTKVIELTNTRKTSHFEHISQICELDYQLLTIDSFRKLTRAQLNEIFG